MKRIALLICLALSVFLLMSCSKAVPSDDSSNQSQSGTVDKLAEPFVSILQNKQTFCSANRQTNMYLSDYKINIRQYSVIDMDSEKDNELAVMFTDGSILILLDNGDTVMGFDFGSSMYQINDDGTYLWKANAGSIYGCSALEYTDSQCKTVELWRVENDASGSAAYYIKDKAVSKEEFETASAQSSKNSVKWNLWTEVS